MKPRSSGSKVAGSIPADPATPGEVTRETKAPTELGMAHLQRVMAEAEKLVGTAIELVAKDLKLAPNEGWQWDPQAQEFFRMTSTKSS